MSAEQQYIDFYREAAGVISQRSLPVMNAAREAAFQNFCAQGFPSRKVEGYKYSDVQADTLSALVCIYSAITASLFIYMSHMQIK